MTKRQRPVLLAVMVAVVAVVGGLIYANSRNAAPGTVTQKTEEGSTPPPVTKSTAPARKLNEKERQLVGTWEFEKVTPPALGSGYRAKLVFAVDGTFTFRCNKIGTEPWGQRGTYRVTGDIVITEPEVGETAVNLIEELTEDRFVQSAHDGHERWIKEWSRVSE